MQITSKEDLKRLEILASKLFPSYCQFAPSKVHTKLGELLTQSEKNIVIVLPRGFGKSIYTWLFFPAWNVLAGKYRYIVYIASSKEKAIMQFRTFRAELESHSLLRSCVEILSNRVDMIEYLDKLTGKMHMIACYGAGQNLRGLRYKEHRPDIVILDDIEDFEEVQSKEQRQKLKEWFFADVLPLSVAGRFFIIGTILHEDSFLNSLVTEPPEGFEVLKYAILDGHGNSIWPERFPVSKIQQIKEEYHKRGLLHIFYAEYMNEPIADETRTFKKEWFQYFNPKDIDLERCSVYTAVDLAISEKETADYTAVVTVAVSPENHWFVLDCDYGRYDPFEQIEAIFRTIIKWKPLKVGIEKVAYQKALIHLLQKEMPKRNIFFEIVPLEAGKAKDIRIRALQPRFQARTIWFPAGAGFLTELEDELLMFPRARHDDLIDALAYVEQIAQPPVWYTNQRFAEEIPHVSAF